MSAVDQVTAQRSMGYIFVCLLLMSLGPGVAIYWLSDSEINAVKYVHITL